MSKEMSEKIVRGNAESARKERAMLPAIDVIVDAPGIVLYADLPGVSKDKLSL
jgi:HSP20 family molecular chaperone IbpA